MFRQGDVYIIPTTKRIPRDAKLVERENGQVILAHGEVTGHCHAIAEKEVSLFATTAEAVDRWLKVGKDAVLTHQEHGHLTIPAGNYIVRRQREYSPEAIRFVAD